MSEKESRRAQREREAAEREFRAAVHRYLGWVATLLVLVAIVVALARMQTMFGVSAWEALGIGATTLPWILLVIGLGVLFSLGTTRLIMAAEKLIGLFKRKKPDA